MEDQIIPVVVILGATVLLALLIWQVFGLVRDSIRYRSDDGNDHERVGRG